MGFEIDKININNKFVLILKPDLDYLLKFGRYVIQQNDYVLTYNDLVDYCVNYTYSNKSIHKSIEKFQGTNDKLVNEENDNFYILEILKFPKDYTLRLIDIIHVINFSRAFKKDIFNINNNLTNLIKLFTNKQNYFQEFNQQFNIQNNKILNTELFRSYSGKNNKLHLFREASFNEIYDLLMNGYVLPQIDNEGIRAKYIYFSYYTPDAMLRLAESYKYMVVFDRNKLVRQGVIVTDEQYKSWNDNYQEQYKNQSAKGSKRIEYGNNNQKFKNAIKNYPQKNPNNLTFKQVNIQYEHEAYCKRIELEKDLITDIMMTYELRNKRYYENFLLLVKLFQNFKNQY